MKAILSLIISGALVVSVFGQTRNVLVGTNNTVVQPTNFWSADASNARTGLGLGTAATNPASVFQPASSVLTNLASGNGGGLTNIQSTNLVGIIPSSNLATVNFSNLAGTLSIASGGTSATNAANARQNLGSTTVGDALFVATNAESARTTIGATTIGSSIFTLANPNAITFFRVNSNNTVSALSASDFRTALSLDTAATNPSSAFQSSSSVLSNLASSNGVNLTNIPVANVVGALVTNGNGFGLTNLNASNITGLIPASNISTVNFSNVVGTLSIASGGTGATNAGGARTNFELGATWLTNTVASNFRTAIGATTIGNALFTATNSTAAINAIGFGDQVLSVSNIKINEFPIGISRGFIVPTSGQRLDLAGTNVTTTVAAFYGFNGFASVAFSASEARTNIGLSFAALTNTNTSGFNASLYGSNTNPVLANSNGEVVSPTNFWQVAPINTRVQYSQPVVNATNAATNARNLYLYSLAISTAGVTNVITLPTSAATFFGDVVTVIHEGPTSSVTAVRQLGSSTNLITLNQFQEAVKFIYNGGGWGLADNISYVEPIYFSGTNASANAAASRTNLGLGATNDVYFQSVIFGTNVASSVAAIDNFGLSIDSDDTNTSVAAISFIGAAIDRMAANTRTNLGLGFPALTNTSVTNFQKAIFYTNTAPSNIGGNLGTIAAWIEIVASNGVTYKIPAYTNVP